MKKRLFDLIKKNKYFIFILLLGLILRLILLSQNPPSLNWDEVSHGYNAYSILKTGKDEWGTTFPVIFKAYGDYKLPVYIYLTAISEAFLGLNAFSVRLPSVIAGVTIVFFTYLLAGRLFGKRIAIISALLVAIEPWSLFLSRGAFEANVALALIISGIYFFIEGLKTRNKLFISAVLLGLSVWTYNSARVFVPLLLASLILIYRNQITLIYKKRRLQLYLFLITILVFVAPMFWQLLNPEGVARYTWVTILDEGAIDQINRARGSSELSPLAARLVHNKGTFIIQRFAENYFSHFSAKYIFTEGGSHYQFSIPNKGLIYPINAFFIILGLYFLLKKKKKESLLIFAWLALAPIPSSLTREAPHVLRSITMLPLPMIISAIGIEGLLKKFKLSSKTKTTDFFIAYLTIVFMFSIFYLNNYFTKYRKDYSWVWQYGYQEVVDYSRQNYGNYDKIIVTKKYGEPHEFFLFFWPWDPSKFQNDPQLVRFHQSNWNWVDRFDKFYFVNDWQVPKDEEESFQLESGGNIECFNAKCLLITSPDNHPENWKKLETVNFLNGEPAFEIYENQ